MTVLERLGELRVIMAQRDVAAYIVPTDDFHGSEYVGEHFKLREFLSGFTGSAGTLVVLADEAALWTDGRYFLQAEQQLSGSGISLMRQGESKTPTIAEYLSQKLKDGNTVGFDKRVMSHATALSIERKLADKKISYHTNEDLGGMVWRERPPLPAKPVWEVREEFAGCSRAEKLARVREKMRCEDADCFVTSAPDETAWLLNLRGGDVDYNPVFLSFMIIFGEGAELFANSSCFSPEIAEKLAADGVKLRDYGDIYRRLGELKGRVLIDSSAASRAFFGAITTEKVIRKSPICLMKAVKNSAEIAAERNAHLKDGVAVTRFMYRLKTGNDALTEISAAALLESFRRQGEGYLGQSFEPIMAYGEHGAIVHYSATEESSADIERRGLLLSDTGGHYVDGTTDITRTFVMGELSAEEKRAFTLVLAGHLDLLCAKFPKGCTGAMIDYAARAPLWREGLDFNHGTGHGVGFITTVHEGPCRISFRGKNDVPLESGMILSDEPGFYAAGKFGIRHESLMLCKEAETTEFGSFLCFEPLTLVPFDLDGVDPALLDARQRAALNSYHALVREKLSPLLPENERMWLTNAAREI